MHLTLRHKVNCAIIITFILIAILYTAIELPLQKHRLQRSIANIEILLETLVERDREELANEIFDNRLKAIKIRLNGMRKVKGVNAICIFDNNGNFIISDLPNTLCTLLKAEKKQHSPQTYIKNNDSLLFTKKLTFLGENLGFIKINYSLKGVKADQRTSFLIYGGLLLTIFFVMLVVLNWMLSKSIITPLMQLRDATKLIDQGDLETDINMHRRDEIGSLAESFEKMRDTVKGKISGLTKAKAELLFLRNYLTSIIDSMPSIIIGLDEDLNVTQWNRKAQTATGIDSEHAYGRKLTEVFTETTFDINAIKLSIHDQKIKNFLKQPRKLNNELHYDDVVIYPLVDKIAMGAVIRIDDVTHKVKMEEMLIQSEKMLSIGGLAAGMAHEINNPLAGIIQNANVMTNRLSNLNLPANIRGAEAVGVSMDTIEAFMHQRGILSMIQAITDSGLRISAIVNNMLGFARKSDTRGSYISIPELMEKTLKLANSDYNSGITFDFRKIRIVRIFDEKIPDAYCEGAKIQQVFLNILRNGAQSMQGNNTHEPCFIISISPVAEKDLIRIEIKDNGPGIDEETRKRIFEPFFTTKTTGSGIGLGLSVSYFIIAKNHGGTMDVITDSGKGAKFIINLPIHRA